MTTKTRAIKIATECGSCGGTGIYCGFMEGPGQGVICVHCRGTGKFTLSYKPFIERKRKRGVKTVRSGSGLIIDDPSKGWISYEEFLRKY